MLGSRRVRRFACAIAITTGMALLLVLTGCRQSPAPMAPSLADRIERITSKAEYRTATWGLLVVDATTGKTLYERNANSWFAPGSTTKLFTTSSALSALGSDYRWKTPVYRRGSVGAGGTLAGSLVLVGTGDPTMGGRDRADGTLAYSGFDHTDAGSDGLLEAQLTTTSPVAGLAGLAASVRAGGIRRVRDVAVDDRLFEPFGVGTHAPAYPISINDNVIDVQLGATTQGAPVTVDWRPRAAGWSVSSSVVTTKPGGEPDIQVKHSGTRITVTGTVPEGYVPVARVVQVPDPAAFARALFIQELEKAGVAVDAPAAAPNDRALLAPSITGYATGDRVAELESLPLAATVELALKVSQNIVANTLPMVLGAQHGGTTMADGLAVERSALTSLGVDPKGVSLADGEGGVRADLISPRAAVDLLVAMSKTPMAERYRLSQPILGVDGSLAASVKADNPARGKVWAKTGTHAEGDPLNGRFLLIAKGIAGYAKGTDGRPLVFAVYVNNLPVTSIDELGAVGDDLAGIAAEIAVPGAGAGR